jgi:hypothetical protein
MRPVIPHIYYRAIQQNGYSSILREPRTIREKYFDSRSARLPQYRDAPLPCDVTCLQHIAGI